MKQLYEESKFSKLLDLEEKKNMSHYINHRSLQQYKEKAQTIKQMLMRYKNKIFY